MLFEVYLKIYILIIEDNSNDSINNYGKVKLVYMLSLTSLRYYNYLISFEMLYFKLIIHADHVN